MDDHPVDTDFGKAVSQKSTIFDTLVLARRFSLMRVHNYSQVSQSRLICGVRPDSRLSRLTMFLPDILFQPIKASSYMANLPSLRRWLRGWSVTRGPPESAASRTIVADLTIDLIA